MICYNIDAIVITFVLDCTFLLHQSTKELKNLYCYVLNLQDPRQWSHSPGKITYQFLIHEC